MTAQRPANHKHKTRRAQHRRMPIATAAVDSPLRVGILGFVFSQGKEVKGKEPPGPRTKAWSRWESGENDYVVFAALIHRRPGFGRLCSSWYRVDLRGATRTQRAQPRAIALVVFGTSGPRRRGTDGGGVRASAAVLGGGGASNWSGNGVETRGWMPPRRLVAAAPRGVAGWARGWLVGVASRSAACSGGIGIDRRRMDLGFGRRRRLFV